MHQGVGGIVIIKALVYFSVCNCHGMSDISAGQSFAEDKDIRQDQIRGKAVSGTSESCGNFVEYKEHTVLVAKFARAFQEGDAVHPHTARTLQQRLDDKTVQAVVVLCKSLFQGDFHSNAAGVREKAVIQISRKPALELLIQNGYRVRGVEDGKAALEALEKEYADLIISDIMMPVMDGYELVRALREAGNQTPVLMITAKDAFDDMRKGFLSGTDDYMVKPINVNEMVLWVGALLRRAQMINEQKLVLGGTELLLDSLTVVTEKDSCVLPQKEFMLLYKMASSPGRTFTRQQIMDDIWGYEAESDTYTVDVHIGRLRERFRDNQDFRIVTIQGVGYKVVKL